MTQEENLEKRMELLEKEIELLKMELSMYHMKNKKEFRRFTLSLSAHRSMLMDLKPMYENFKKQKVEGKQEVERSYG